MQQRCKDRKNGWIIRLRRHQESWKSETIATSVQYMIDQVRDTGEDQQVKLFAKNDMEQECTETCTEKKTKKNARKI